MRDDDIRSSCFASLDVLCAKFGPELPYKGALDQGFAFRGRRIPFLNFQKGIYKAAAQSGPAALSVNTSYKSPYDDQETPDGFIYAYRAGDIDQPDNRALRAAFQLQVPIIYFVGTRPGWYRPEWPVFVTSDDPIARAVTLTPGRMVGPYDEREPLSPRRSDRARLRRPRDARAPAPDALPRAGAAGVREPVRDLPAQGDAPPRRRPHRRRRGREGVCPP